MPPHSETVHLLDQLTQVVDEHMTRLAEEHMETRFLKIDAERSPFLVERLRLGRSMRGLCVRVHSLPPSVAHVSPRTPLFLAAVAACG